MSSSSWHCVLARDTDTTALRMRNHRQRLTNAVPAAGEQRRLDTRCRPGIGRFENGGGARTETSLIRSLPLWLLSLQRSYERMNTVIDIDDGGRHVLIFSTGPATLPEEAAGRRTGSGSAHGTRSRSPLVPTAALRLLR